MVKFGICRTPEHLFRDFHVSVYEEVFLPLLNGVLQNGVRPSFSKNRHFG